MFVIHYTKLSEYGCSYNLLFISKLILILWVNVIPYVELNKTVIMKQKKTGKQCGFYLHKNQMKRCRYETECVCICKEVQ